MKYDVIDLPHAHQQMLDETPERRKVRVTLLDRDRLPLASGTAILPLMLGVGVFWPSCPMPAAKCLAKAECFALPTGETMKLKAIMLCTGCPPHYDFWVSQP